MPIPVLRPGLVINYSYLWHSEERLGKEEGVKDRPCAVILTSEEKSGQIKVVAAPMTHAVPADPQDAVEIPLAVKQELGLDMDRSWVVVNEVNRFLWPGPDLRPVSRREADRFDFGMLPQNIFKKVLAAILDQHSRQRLKMTVRTDG